MRGFFLSPSQCAFLRWALPAGLIMAALSSILGLLPPTELPAHAPLL